MKPNLGPIQPDAIDADTLRAYLADELPAEDSSLPNDAPPPP